MQKVSDLMWRNSRKISRRAPLQMPYNETAQTETHLGCAQPRLSLLTISNIQGNTLLQIFPQLLKLNWQNKRRSLLPGWGEGGDEGKFRRTTRAPPPPPPPPPPGGGDPPTPPPN